MTQQQSVLFPRGAKKTFRGLAQMRMMLAEDDPDLAEADLQSLPENGRHGLREYKILRSC
ncbi:hypothetical protein FNJ84_21490 [Paracoccus sp. M683]|uniref:hypothetical protein n=1 Tax=Paracoccus sp. M683 TaxID=2594268 RepID=UPI00117D50B0|nr:hypothetical protein [Paracoccus sp. M683]TRW91451.1 hypothetical protein FNJ84_21490 [Paracoccus sp. M683]